MLNTANKLPVTNLQIKDKTYNGHLVKAEKTVATCFILFIENRVSGSLTFFERWDFMVAGSHLPELDAEECDMVAGFLGKTVTEAETFTG